jgi:chorismate synthase
MDFINKETSRRRPGQNQFSTTRKEEDIVEILSGVFEGITTGTPIGFVIYNSNQKSSDYDAIKDIFRPGHADFTYYHKYGIRDYRGGGRSSARETAGRVVAGAFAKLLLREIGIVVRSGVYAIGGVEAKRIDFENSINSEIFALDNEIETVWKNIILDVKNEHDSIGGTALIEIINLPIGIGEPIFYKLDSAIGSAILGLNGVKAVEIGDGIKAGRGTGSTNNDNISKNGFVSNHSGGMLGGISNGDIVRIKAHFKPTPSIFLEQNTIDINYDETTIKLKGRHDPCIVIRGSVVAEAMVALVCADLLLLNMNRKLDNIIKVYK